jgi:cytochrome c553
LSITRAKADDMYDIPNWFPSMYPPMPKIVQYGNKDAQVRACGSCHLPTGAGHDESAYVAGLPAAYFIRQMADWKSGDRKYSATMVAMAKVITDAEIRDSAEYFASIKPRPWIRVVETDTVPKSYVGPGNKRLLHPDGGSEPIGNRIIEVPEDEEVVVYRDPSSGFVAYGRRQHGCLRHLPWPYVARLGRAAGNCGTPSQLHRSPALEHAERRSHRHVGGADDAGGRKVDQRRHAGDRSLCRIAGAVTREDARSWLEQDATLRTLTVVAGVTGRLASHDGSIYQG